MKFDFVIGNPPYQSSRTGTRDEQIYNHFIDASEVIGDKALLIHPGRFLFNAGDTPTEWNNKMLHNKHFKIISYFTNGKEIFANTDIKGGIAISYYDASKDFGEIEVFSPFKEIRNILNKVKTLKEPSLMDIAYAAGIYKYQKCMYEDHPNLYNLLPNKTMLASNCFSVLRDVIFFENKNQSNFIGFYGRLNGERTICYADPKYFWVPDNFYNYKVLVPKSNGSGALGEALSTPLIGQPLIGQPLIGHTQTFISIGNFMNQGDAENCLKYIKSKFARTMLGVLKVTQHNAPPVWKYVPLQDFTETSDVDWSKPISEIDQQLYKKYGLTQEEINFIESKVRSMETPTADEEEVAEDAQND